MWDAFEANNSHTKSNSDGDCNGFNSRNEFTFVDNRDSFNSGGKFCFAVKHDYSNSRSESNSCGTRNGTHYSLSSDDTRYAPHSRSETSCRRGHKNTNSRIEFGPYRKSAN